MQPKQLSAPQSSLQGLNLIKTLMESIKKSADAAPKPNGAPQSTLLQRLANDLVELSATGCNAADALEAIETILAGFNQLNAAITEARQEVKGS
jgi:hypothetical protein